MDRRCEGTVILPLGSYEIAKDVFREDKKNLCGLPIPDLLIYTTTVKKTEDQFIQVDFQMLLVDDIIETFIEPNKKWATIFEFIFRLNIRNLTIINGEDGDSERIKLQYNWEDDTLFIFSIDVPLYKNEITKVETFDKDIAERHYMIPKFDMMLKPKITVIKNGCSKLIRLYHDVKQMYFDELFTPEERYNSYIFDKSNLTQYIDTRIEPHFNYSTSSMMDIIGGIINGNNEG